jgi:hypothetical protein
VWAISGNVAASEKFSSSFNHIASAACAAPESQRRRRWRLDDVRDGARFRGGARPLFVGMRIAAMVCRIACCSASIIFNMRH